MQFGKANEKTQISTAGAEAKKVSHTSKPEQARFDSSVFFFCMLNTVLISFSKVVAAQLAEVHSWLQRESGALAAHRPDSVQRRKERERSGGAVERGSPRLGLPYASGRRRVSCCFFEENFATAFLSSTAAGRGTSRTSSAGPRRRTDRAAISTSTSEAFKSSTNETTTQISSPEVTSAFAHAGAAFSLSTAVRCPAGEACFTAGSTAGCTADCVEGCA